MRSLVLDVGNTAVKAGFFDEAGHLTAVRRVADAAALRAEVTAFAPARALVASVATPAEDVRQLLALPSANTLVMQPGLAWPIRLAYQTPQTLGADRVATAVGAAQRFPGCPVLILDAGTCLKADLVTADGTFRGGSISPGLRMRFEALATFTARLPRLAPASAASPPTLPGDSTDASIRAGVEVGFVAEAAAFVAHYAAQWPGLYVVPTGGDGEWLAARLPAVAGCTFVPEPDLVLWGLYRILLHNSE